MRTIPWCGTEGVPIGPDFRSRSERDPVRRRGTAYTCRFLYVTWFAGMLTQCAVPRTEPSYLSNRNGLSVPYLVSEQFINMTKVLGSYSIPRLRLRVFLQTRHVCCPRVW